MLSKPIYKEELDALNEFIGDFEYNCDDYVELTRMFNKIYDENRQYYEANRKLLIQINAGKPFGGIVFTKEEAELVEENITVNGVSA